MFAKYFHLFIRALAASTTHRTWKLKTRQNNDPTKQQNTKHGEHAAVSNKEL
jgi:hypothetical protein